MNNRIRNILIFNYLIIHSMERVDNEYRMMDDYFQEKMKSILGISSDKDGNDYTFKMWKKFLIIQKNGSILFDFFNFMETLDFEKVSGHNLIYQYQVGPKKEFRIVGLHFNLTDKLVKKVIPNFFKRNKDLIREFKLGRILT